MIPFRGGKRRVLFLIFLLVTSVAMFYEVINLTTSNSSETIRDWMIHAHSGSPRSFRTKNHNIASNTLNSTSKFTTIAPYVVQKLNSVFEQLDMIRSENVSRSLFPAFQIGEEYLMLNPNICRDVKTIDVIIIVHTAPGNVRKRDRIRNTFADRNLFLPKQVRIAFLLGKAKDPDMADVLQREHDTYNDTIMGDFYDDYHNLTLKGVMGFHWVGEYCPNAKVVLKIDDDVVLDMYNLLSRYMPHIEGKRKSIFCNTWRKNMAILRTGRWRVPGHLFRDKKLFPYYYCSGFTVLLTTDLMRPMYRAAKLAPFFWIDDLYLFGILPKVVGGITYYDYQLGKNVSLFESKTLACMDEHGQDCPILSTLVHGRTSGGLWPAIQKLRNKTVDSNYVQSYYEP